MNELYPDKTEALTTTVLSRLMTREEVDLWCGCGCCFVILDIIIQVVT